MAPAPSKTPCVVTQPHVGCHKPPRKVLMGHHSSESSPGPHQSFHHSVYISPTNSTSYHSCFPQLSSLHLFRGRTERKAEAGKQKGNPNVTQLQTELALESMSEVGRKRADSELLSWTDSSTHLQEMCGPAGLLQVGPCPEEFRTWRDLV